MHLWESTDSIERFNKNGFLTADRDTNRNYGLSLQDLILK